MTREEALEEITAEFNEFLKGTGLDDKDYLESEMVKNEDLRRVVEANRMAIKILSIEPCEDCISKKVVCDLICEDMSKDKLLQTIQDLQSVRPMRLKGKWLRDEYGTYCSKCQNGMGIEYKFCPCCGADMREYI